MIYTVEDNIIVVHDKSQFNPKQILECGQVFRYGTDENNNYYVISTNKKATIIECEDCYKIISNDAKYFVNYFDLETDYNKIKKVLKQNKTLSPMVDYGYGIRILNGNPLETIFSFIVSQNNHITRIKKIIEKLCQIGDKIDDFCAFPTLKQLSDEPLEFYQSLGAGYRDKFLKKTADDLTNYDLDKIIKLDSPELFKFLTSLSGIGPKVASCIMLFGFGRKNFFPVDTWIEQVYYNHFSKKKLPRVKIQKYFEDIFKENSGLAQQYLFYYEREKKR